MELLKLRPKKVLFIATRQIGDVLVTTPLISRARELWPSAQFHFLGFTGTLDMLKGNPAIQELIETSARPSIKEYISLFKRLFLKYDLAIMTQPSDRTYLFGLITSKQRIGLLPPEKEHYKNSTRWKKAICKHTIHINYFTQHAVIEKIRLLNVFYLNEQDYLLKAIYVTPPAAIPLPPSIEQQLKKPYVVVHITPSAKYKRWPLVDWKNMITWLIEEGWQVILSSSSNQEELNYNQELMSLLDKEKQKNIINTKGILSIQQVVSLLNNAELYIGIDTSITHLAAACGVKTIALFGPTPPTNFGPWPNGFTGASPYQLKARHQTVGNVTIIQGVQACVPCRKAGCEDNAKTSLSMCLELLDALDIITIIKKQILEPTFRSKSSI